MVKNFETKWGKFKRSNLPWLLPLFVLSSFFLLLLSMINPKDYPTITSIKQGATNVIKNIIDPSIPQVVGANFDLNYKKVPYDTEYLEFTFSTELNSSSITGSVFSISPVVEGELELVSPNILRYNLSEKLELGTDYDITLSSDIKSIKNKNLENTYTYLVRAVEKAQVLKITPEGELSSLDQKIRVFFNIPMVPLSSIDNKKKLPCPVEIEPSVEGTCKWLTNSMVEFNPTKGLQGATVYNIKVKTVDSMMYDINESRVTISTPKLQITNPYYKYDTAAKFDIASGVNLVFNYPVTIQEIQKNINFTLSGENLEVFVNKIGKSERSFYITLRGKDFTYDTDYKLVITKGLMPKYGTVALTNDYEIFLKSNSLLGKVYPYRTVLSSTGVVLDEEYAVIDNNLATKNLFFNLAFQEDVGLFKKNFSFYSSDGQGECKGQDVCLGVENIDFDLVYNKKLKQGGKSETTKKSEKLEEEDNKRSLKMILKSPLKSNTTYTLKIDKAINLKLTDDILRKYTTSDNLKITNFKNISYRKSCMYLNNSVNTQEMKKSISMSPEGAISYVSDYRYIPWELENELDNIELLSSKNSYLINEGYCPYEKEGEKLYIIYTKLNPNIEYTMTLSGSLEDVYGNNLGGDYSGSFTTGPIKIEDKYITTSLPNTINIIPDNLPIVVDFLTMNMEKINIQVCEMNKDNYIEYLKNLYNYSYTPLCTTSVYKDMDVKNMNWKYSHNKYDLEDDILQRKFNDKIVMIRAFREGQENATLTKIFVRSSIVLAMEEGANKNLLMVTSLDGKTNIEGITTSFYSRDYDYDTRIYTYNSLDINPTFNTEKGVYEFDADENISLVIVEKDGAVGMIDTNYDALSNYDFKQTSGDTAYDKNYLYLYTDRPLYKPKDTVYFKGLLREFGLEGYGKSSVEKGKLKVYDQNYDLVTELDITVDDNSNFNGEFILSEDVSLGRFTFEFSSESEYISNSAVFYIEEYEKPVFKVEANPNKRDIAIGNKVNIDILSQYYFGGNLINANGNYSITSQGYFFDAKDYSYYQFGEGYRYMDCIYWGYCSYDDSYEDDYEVFAINEKGKYSLEYDFTGKKGEKIYTFNFEVKDPDTQKTVNKATSIVLHNTDAYVGLQTSYWTDSKKGVDVDLIVLDYEAQPLKEKKVGVQVIKREWQEVKKEGVDGYYYNDYTVKETLEKELEFTSNDKGEIQQNIKTIGAGEYEIKAIYTGSNNNSFTSSRVIYVSGEDYVQWYDDNNDTTELISDKQMLNVGDTQEYVLKSPVNSGKALIVIERDNDILDYFVHDIVSFGDKIQIEVKENYYPNFYVKAFLIGQKEGNPLPTYKRALAITQVNTEHKKLNVDIKTDKDLYLPGATVKLTINVTDYKDKPVAAANGTIAIVDESLLALKGNPKKNPYAYFYDMKRYLEVTTYTSLRRLVKILEVKDLTDGEKGGGGGASASAEKGSSTKKRGEFKDTAYWKADFVTDANGQFVINTEKLPDNLTTWAIEVLVNTTDDNKLGVAYDSVIVNKELMINDNLPAFLSIYDEAVLAPVIFNKSGADREFRITLEAEGVEIKDNSQKIVILSDTQKTIPFKINVNNVDLEVLKVNIKAESVNGKYVDEVEKYIQIKENVTPEYVSTTGKVKDLAVEEKINLSNMDRERGKLTINYSATLLVSILDGIDFLNKFPYGCSEQKTSAIMPNIFIKELYNSIGKEFDLTSKYIEYWAGDTKGYKEKSVDATIKEYLAGIGSYQMLDGGFAYWYDGYDGDFGNSDLYLTTYILSSLSQIESLGYSIEKTILSKANKYLAAKFYNNRRPKCKVTMYDDCKYSDVTRLKVIDSMLDYNSNNYDTYKMWQIISPNLDNNKSINILKIKVIGKLLNINGLSQEIKELLEKEAIELVNVIINDELVYTPRGAYIGRTSYYTREVNTASFIEAVSYLGLDKIEDIEPILDNMLRWLVAQKDEGSFGSTQDNISVIKAITKYLEVSGELDNISLAVKLRLNEDIIKRSDIGEGNKLETFSQDINISSMAENNSFHIEKSGKGNVYYDMNLSYYMSSIDIKAMDEGISVKKMYYDYNEYRRISALKKEEWSKYRDGKIEYDDLEYPKDVIDYMKSVKNGKVGDLLIVHNEIITSETRDKVAFEGYIPAGSQLVNVNLATESASVKDVLNSQRSLFSKVEYRTDRYFGYTDTLYTGVYTEDYVIRLTHSGIYNVRPTRVSEFYNPEVFGRTNGMEFVIIE